MDRSLEPWQDAPGGPATAEEPQQQPPQAPTQPSGSQQPVQPTPAFAQPTGLAAASRPLSQTESDRAFRASRAPISRPLSSATGGHYEETSDQGVGYGSPHEQPIRRSSAPLPQLAPLQTRGQPGGQEYYGQGTHRAPDAPPPVSPPHMHQWSSALGRMLPHAERPKVYVVSNTLLSIHPVH